jgi:DNA-binding beta-propeller fold protein YncE
VTGEEITSSLVGTVPAAIGVAVSGTNLYVMNTENNSVAEYNSTTGSEENGSLITGLYPSETALSAAGNYVYISDGGNVLEYSATSGSFIAYAADLSSPKGIAISGSNLYVAQGGANGTVAESNGNYISENSNFITGLDYPAFVAVSPIPEAECWYLVFLGVGLTCIVRCAERRQSTKPFAVPTINTCCLICFPVGYGKARP